LAVLLLELGLVFEGLVKRMKSSLLWRLLQFLESDGESMAEGGPWVLERGEGLRRPLC
jgi:hypothetical protein